MTKSERARLRHAIELLWEEDDWEGAMRILLPLAGLHSPALEAIDGAAPESLSNIANKEPTYIDLDPISPVAASQSP